ncbi:Retrovirus-related Pol polyprotein from type-1 retrotransposable element R1 4 [Eumeta japonica]|uniref:Retrovirus-related Pol polyprotein from type-1 retrotransposable element R1 4 n=1 Tax=Eumeta variegata TaxID=151549 RepID=A0A4C1YYG0_EUMVA|nr:Retrovirus-related Pol polyprotein from type-1 retrotransposable element R1 4 [Eumeta japonica]
MTVKGRLQRASLLRVEDAPIAAVNDVRRTVGQFTQLGVRCEICERKAAKCFGKMNRVSTSSWGDVSALRREASGTIILTWQECWNGASEGREFHSFFPDVRTRIDRDFVKPDYVTFQMIIGHGCFRKRLYDMRLNERKNCNCGWNEETWDHVLWNCPLHEEELSVMMNELDYMYE